MSGILAIEYALPEKLLTNAELVQEFQTWTEEKIYQKTGIMSRHVTEVGETALDLAEKATNKLFESGVIQKSEVDFLIMATQSPEYVLPTTACLLQERLGLNSNVGAFDLNLGCSAYIYGLSVAKGLIAAGIAHNVLLVTGDTYSKYVNPLDRSTRTIFGDAATATLIGEGGMEIGQFDLGTDGSGKDLLMVPAGGTRLPKSAETGVEEEIEGNVRSKDNLYMDGAGVFEFTIREVPASVKRLLEKEGHEKEQVDLFVFHQANKFMLEFLRKSMKLNADKFYMNFSDTGNTVSSSIPIALKRAIDEGVIKENQSILLSGFGVGLSWGTTILRTGGDKK